MHNFLLTIANFQSSLPTRGSDPLPSFLHRQLPFFNPRSPRGGATHGRHARLISGRFSILAPHEGERRDTDTPTLTQDHGFQSSLPTRGSDLRPSMHIAASTCFQSSLPTRGSDSQLPPIYPRMTFFNPRSPRGGATGCAGQDRPAAPIFNPRSPRGGATRMACGQLRTGRLFNPRSPRGGATGRHGHAYQADQLFNPRSPRGGATHYILCVRVARQFSILAPHEGERRVKP